MATVWSIQGANADWSSNVGGAEIAASVPIIRLAISVASCEPNISWSQIRLSRGADEDGRSAADSGKTFAC
jgi:hypothetical protein